MKIVLNKIFIILILIGLSGIIIINVHGNKIINTNNIVVQNTYDSMNIQAYVLRNSQGMEVEVLNLGGIISAIKVPDRKGNIENVVLGFEDHNRYQSKHPFFGAIVGRYANRIAEAKFSLDNKVYELSKNNYQNHIHGGFKGFDKVIWDVSSFETSVGSGLEMTYYSPDGEEGYPGNLQTTVRYTLTNDNTLIVEYFAKCDKKTIINLTQHSYFNLRGQGDILEHELQLLASEYLPINANQLPTGDIRQVDHSPFDFRTYKRIGKDINQNTEQILLGSGYDHFFIFDNYLGKDKDRLVAKLKDNESGRILEVYSTEYGAQLYTGNFLDGSLIGNYNKPIPKRGGVCIETSGYPNAPNINTFPSTVLDPEEEYYGRTIFKFLTE